MTKRLYNRKPLLFGDRIEEPDQSLPRESVSSCQVTRFDWWDTGGTSIAACRRRSTHGATSSGSPRRISQSRSVTCARRSARRARCTSTSISGGETAAYPGAAQGGMTHGDVCTRFNPEAGG